MPGANRVIAAAALIKTSRSWVLIVLKYRKKPLKNAKHSAKDGAAPSRELFQYHDALPAVKGATKSKFKTREDRVIKIEAEEELILNAPFKNIGWSVSILASSSIIDIKIKTDTISINITIAFAQLFCSLYFESDLILFETGN